MSKLKQTYQQKLFNDEELGLVEHDDIVRWTDKLVRHRPERLFDALGIVYDPGTVECLDVQWEPIITTNTQRSTATSDPSGVRFGTITPKGYNKSAMVVGALDLEAHVTWRHKGIDREQYLIFEAKAKIRTAGELIRQLQLYREYTSGIFVVVAPPQAFRGEIRTILMEQKFHTIIYQSDI
jgi:hypothetical protein